MGAWWNNNNGFINGQPEILGCSLVLHRWICYCFYYTANFSLYTGDCSKTANVKGVPKSNGTKKRIDSARDILEEWGHPCC